MLKNKVVLVTGASRGIGLSIAQTLVDHGAQVAFLVNTDKSYQTMLPVIERLSQQGAKVLLLQADVSQKAQCQEVVKKVIDQFGQLDVLVNNAGITKDGLFVRMSEENIHQVLQVNLVGAMYMSQSVLPIMMKQKQGKIINIASVVGLMGNAGQANYAASKAGLIGFTKSLAKEYGARNIMVNAIAPGFIKSDMTAQLSEEMANHIQSQLPAKRLGEPQEVANVVLFLASSLSSYITGEVIKVDGGMYI